MISLAHRFLATVARIVFFALCATAVRGQDLSQYQGQDPRTLFNKSWAFPSDAEKVAIRTYLVRNSAETEYGCISKAWLCDYEGDGHGSKLYQVCSDRYLKSRDGLRNMQGNLPPK